MGVYRLYVQPAVIGILVFITWRLSRGKYSRLRRQREKAIFLIGILSLWIIGYFLSGLVVTFVQNPLMGDMTTAAINMLLYGGGAVALEWVRHRIVLMTGRKRPILAGGVVALSLLVFQTVALTLSLSDAISVITMLGAVMLPLVVYHIVQTYLAYTAGFMSMVVYAVAWTILYTLLPIMPKYDWYMVGMSALVLGVLIVLLLDRTRQDVDRPVRMGKRQQGQLANGLFVGFMVVLILFMTGVFSYKPVVIMSNSMMPIYGRGDMVVVRQKTPSMKIAVGDIIQYSHDGRIITHRVAELAVDKDVVQYITRGDNSDSNDPWLVSIDQVGGIVQARIPFVGYPTVILNEILQD